MLETKEGIIKLIVYIGIIKNGKLLLVEYKNTPNPLKAGWWIPAPELQFGENPLEKVQKTCEEFGLTAQKITLNKIESFTSPGGWHYISHYIVNTEMEITDTSNIKNYCWVNEEELKKIQNMAHGKWEVEVGREYLSKFRQT